MQTASGMPTWPVEREVKQKNIAAKVVIASQSRAIRYPTLFTETGGSLNADPGMEDCEASRCHTRASIVRCPTSGSPNDSRTLGKRNKGRGSALICSHGTMNGRWKGLNRRDIPTRRPDGHALSVRTPPMWTPNPIRPNSILSVSLLTSFLEGKRCCNRNQPDVIPRMVVMTSHIPMKKTGKKYGNRVCICSFMSAAYQRLRPFTNFFGRCRFISHQPTTVKTHGLLPLLRRLM